MSAKTRNFFVILHAQIFNWERWPSGRRRTPGKCVNAESVSRVRIPFSPQFIYLNNNKLVKKETKKNNIH